MRQSATFPIVAFVEKLGAHRAAWRHAGKATQGYTLEAARELPR